MSRARRKQTSTGDAARQLRAGRSRVFEQALAQARTEAGADLLEEVLLDIAQSPQVMLETPEGPAAGETLLFAVLPGIRLPARLADIDPLVKSFRRYGLVGPTSSVLLLDSLYHPQDLEGPPTRWYGWVQALLAYLSGKPLLSTYLRFSDQAWRRYAYPSCIHRPLGEAQIL